MLITILIAFGSAIVGGVLCAVIGAYLQKRWTPDVTGELAKLRDELAELREELATSDLERADLDHLPLEITLLQGVPQNYIALIKNQSDKQIELRAINLECDAVPLSTPHNPRDGETWFIEPRDGIRLTWSPSPDPVMTLRNVRPGFQRGETIPIQFVLTYRVRGRTCARKFTATAAMDSDRMSVWNSFV